MASVQLNPYLMINDQAREATGSYREVFGGELTLRTFAGGGMSAHPSNDDRIRHAHPVTPL